MADWKTCKSPVGRTRRGPLSASFGAVALALLAVMVAAACDSEGPTSPTPPTTSSAGSTIATTSSTTTSARTTSTISGQGCRIERLGSLAAGSTVQRRGTLGRDCVSPNYSGEFARYYSFSLSQRRTVEIDMLSNEVAPWLVLLSGEGTTGGRIDVAFGNCGSNDACMEVVLSAGTYTIEATTVSIGEAGSFELRVRVASSRTTTTSRRTTTTSRRTTTTSRRTTTTSRRTTTTSVSQRREVVFELEDGCYDNRRTEYRFYLYNSSDSRIGVWPDRNRVYVMSDGESNRHVLHPTSSGNVCYGARVENDPGGGYWGVGIDGTRGCDDCCVRTREGRTVTHPGASLTC